MSIDAKSMIEEINRAVRDDDVDLSTWETDFIESVGGCVDAGIALSEKQDAVLVRIWKKCTQ